SLAARSIVRSLARTTKTLTLSLHDALPILVEFPAPIQRQIKRKMVSVAFKGNDLVSQVGQTDPETVEIAGAIDPSKTEMQDVGRSEEHTSELQSREKLVCRLLLEKKNWR